MRPRVRPHRTPPTARFSGGEAADPFAVLPRSSRERLRPASVPAWTSPMLATLTELRFTDPDWLLRPDLVAQIGFSEWTADRRLRHPRFEGLRSDKDPREIVRETPVG